MYPVGRGTGGAAAVFHGSGLVHFAVGALFPEGIVVCGLLGGDESVHLRQALVLQFAAGNPGEGFGAFHAAHVNGPVGMVQGAGLIGLDAGVSRVFGNLRVGVGNLVAGFRYLLLTSP